jgi:hypothetical protein
VAVVGVVVPRSNAADSPAAVAAGRGGQAPVDGRVGREVTLPTGDRVVVGRDAGGRPTTRLAAGRGVPVLHYAAGQHTYVLPLDAMRLLHAGRADVGQFDVTGAAVAAGALGRAPASRPSAATSADLTVRTIDRAGAVPTLSAVMVVNLDTGDTLLPDTTNGGFTVTLPVGRYALWGSVETAATATDLASLTMVFVPQLRLTGSSKVVLDARAGRQVREVVSRSNARRFGEEQFGIEQTVAGQPWVAFGDVESDENLYVVPTSTTAPGFGFFHRTTLVEPDVTLDTGPGTGQVPIEYANDSNVPHIVGDAGLIAVDGGAGTLADLSKVDVRGRLVLLTLGPDTVTDAVARVADVAAAGGRAVLLTRPHRPFPVTPFALPVVLTDASSGDRLLAAARPGGVSVRLHGTAGSSYQYNLLTDRTGAIPAAPVFTVPDANLAVVATHYAAQAVPSAIVSAETDSTTDNLIHRVEFTAPVTRTEYFSTDPVPGTTDPVTWSTAMTNESTWDTSGPGGGGDTATRGPYRPGKYVERFNVGPAGPCVSEFGADAALLFFSGDNLFSEMPVACQGDPPHYDGGTGPFRGEFSGSMVIRRDGVEIGRSDNPGRGVFPVPAVAGSYEVQVDATRAQSWSTLNTSQKTDWSFPWTDPLGVPPMLAVRYVTPLDDRNHAPAGGHTLTVWVDRAATTEAVQTPTVQVSYDDGATWSPVTLRPTGDRWNVFLTPPAGARYVSLRAKAADTAGSSVTQETIRAYALG